MKDKQEKLDSELKEYFQKEFGITVDDGDLVEIRESLYHLGKAIYLYHLQKFGGGNE